MKICFVRHGDNINDKLTKLGKLQAKIVCNDLNYENIAKIYVSPKRRTVDTAKIIAKLLQTALKFCIFVKRYATPKKDNSNKLVRYP